MEEKKLCRSSERMVAGVCGGLAKYLGMDPTIMRVIFAVATVLFPGSGIVVYAILWFVMPECESDGAGAA